MLSTGHQAIQDTKNSTGSGYCIPSLTKIMPFQIQFTPFKSHLLIKKILRSPTNIKEIEVIYLKFFGASSI